MKKISLALVCAAFATLAVVSIRKELTIREIHGEVRQLFFASIRPMRLANCTFERFGSAHDGGYLMCANLLGGVKSAYSYGSANDDNWGCDVSKTLAVPVHEYDCFDLRRPACQGGVLDFHEECVGAEREHISGQSFDSVMNQMERNGDAGKLLAVKMDVEGSELDALPAMPDEVPASIDQPVASARSR